MVEERVILEDKNAARGKTDIGSEFGRLVLTKSKLVFRPKDTSVATGAMLGGAVGALLATKFSPSKSDIVISTSDIVEV